MRRAACAADLAALSGIGNPDLRRRPRMAHRDRAPPRRPPVRALAGARRFSPVRVRRSRLGGPAVLPRVRSRPAARHESGAPPDRERPARRRLRRTSRGGVPRGRGREARPAAPRSRAPRPVRRRGPRARRGSDGCHARAGALRREPFLSRAGLLPPLRDLQRLDGQGASDRGVSGAGGNHEGGPDDAGSSPSLPGAVPAPSSTNRSTSETRRSPARSS